MSNLFDQIIVQHLELQEAFLNDPDRVQIETIKSFIREISKAGGSVSDVEQREHLRKILKQWAEFVYENTDDYPTFQLAPFSRSDNNDGKPDLLRLFSRLGLVPTLVIGTLIIGIILLFWVWTASGQFPFGSPTPTSTSTPLPTVTVSPTPTVSPTLTLTLTPPPAPPAGSPIISSPADGEVVPMLISVSGAGVEIAGTGANLYIFVYPHNDVYYPQSTPYVNADDGTWESIEVIIGRVGEADIGKLFNICALLTNQQLDFGENGYLNELPSAGPSSCITVMRGP